MLVVDGNQHEVFEVDDDCVWASGRNPCVNISFAEFEKLTFNPPGPMHAGLFANILQHRHAIVAVKLHSSGFAWGARLSVRHDGELTNVPCMEFGGDLLVLWPVATSIHAFFELKEAKRREVWAGTETDDPFPPKPSVSVVPHEGVLGHQDVPAARKLATHELTVGQRIFLACLPPAGTAFQTRHKKDKWVAAMEQKDEREYQQLPSARSSRKRSRRSRCWWAATADAPVSSRRAPIEFDLPDEVVMHVVAMRLCEEMATSESIREAVATLLRASRQFQRATRQVMASMQMRVRLACASLCDARSTVPIARVRLLLQGSGLPIRAALSLHGPWYEYVRARRAHEARTGRVGVFPRARLLSAQLLFDAAPL